MKKLFMLLGLLVVGFMAISGRDKYSVYAVGFYNQENLFDTCHDEGKNDYDFLPNGSYKWDGLKHTNKLCSMARTPADMDTDVLPDVGCTPIRPSEVENTRVFDALVAQEPLAARGYHYIHVEGPDRRGIDRTVLYNPQLFKPASVKLVPYVQLLEKNSVYFTRGFLTATGTMGGDHVATIVCHWPSRYSGSFYREVAAAQVKAIKDSLLQLDPATKVMVMGDMNNDPTNKSMAEVLSAKAETNNVGDGNMYNPWYNILANHGRRALMYQGEWNLFDQIVLPSNTLNQDGRRDYSSLKYWKGQIVHYDYLIQSTSKCKGAPERMTAGDVWLNGYSDHLPVVVYLVKQQQR